MRTTWLLASWGMAGCTPEVVCVIGMHAEDGRCVVDSEGDTDTDSDTDSDTDADTDSDTDSDSDTDVDLDGFDRSVCGDGSADHTDIQAAIDASSPGQTIGVCPGSYGPIVVPWSFDVEITAVGGYGVTTIDGGAGPAVVVEDGALVLSGFTIRGTGTDDGFYPDGGALSVKEGTAWVRDSRVTGTSGPFAVFFDENTLVMDRVVFEDNTSRYLWYLYEGGKTGEGFVARNCMVRGGVHETIVATALDDVWVTMSNNVFTDIRATGKTAALYFDDVGGGTQDIANNVFHDIHHDDPYAGACVSVTGGTFTNNIVVGCNSEVPDPLAANYSLFWNNGDDGETVTGAGNLFADPLFVDPAGGDFRLEEGSPGIDAGDPAAAFQDADGTRNDIGIEGGPFAR